MNRLKYIFGVNVSRRVPSNVTLVPRCTHQNEILLKNCQSKVQSIRIDQFPATCNFADNVKHYHDYKIEKPNVICVQKRPKPKPSVVSRKAIFDRKFSLESVKPTRRYSTGHIFKFGNCSSSKRKTSEKDVGKRMSSSKCKGNVCEKNSKSYAEMIAEYSLINLRTLQSSMQKCVFSTLSTVSANNKRPVEKAGSKSKLQGARILNTPVKYNKTEKTGRKNTRSYAELIADYSTNIDVKQFGKSNNQRLKDTKVNTSVNLSSDIQHVNANPMIQKQSTKSSNSEKIQCSYDRIQSDWLHNMEGVIKDLKAVAKKDNILINKNVIKLEENEQLRSANEARWLDEVVKAHRKKLKENESKSSVSTNATPKKNPVNFKKVENKTSYNSSRSVSNSPSSIKKDSGSNLAEKSKLSSKPRVQLKMVPSANESLVSINVDSNSKKSSLNESNELSVTVESNKDKALGQPSVKESPNLGSMLISISEESAAVKQIEFSMNGRPVSEVKSITARTGKLDVVSSLDKIEIRVPCSKEERALEERKDLLKINEESVLSLQISAKYEEPKTEPSAESLKVEPKNEPKPKSPVVPTSHYVFRTFDGVKGIEGSNSFHSEFSQSNVRNMGTSGAKTVINNKKCLNESKKLESKKERVPSKVIPWWSSDDGFNEMRKENETPAVLTNISQKELSKSKSLGDIHSTPNLAKSEINNARDTTKLTDTFSSNILQENYVKSLKQSGIFKPRSKRRKDSTISKMIKNELEKQNEMPSSKSENTVVDGEKKTAGDIAESLKENTKDNINSENKNVTSNTPSDTVETKIENVKSSNITAEDLMRLSVKKTSEDILGTVPKTEIKDHSKFKRRPENSSKSDKQQSWSNLKRIKSMDEAPPKTKIDMMRPIEKRKDGTLIDYGIRVPSRGKPEKFGRIQPKQETSNPASSNLARVKKVRSDESVKFAAKAPSSKQKFLEEYLAKKPSKARPKTDDRPSSFPSAKTLKSEHLTEAEFKKSEKRKISKETLFDNIHQTDKTRTVDSPLAGTVINQTAKKPENKPKGELAALAEGIPQQSSSNIETAPLAGTIVQTKPSTNETIKSPASKLSYTGMAPLAGTITVKASSRNIPGAKKESSSRNATSRTNNAINKNVSESNVPTGPAGLKMGLRKIPGKRFDEEELKSNTSIARIPEYLGKSDSNQSKTGSCDLSSTDRPEKHLLYSAWLQRFESNAKNSCPKTIYDKTRN